MRCHLCPRNCGADRIDSFGFCGAGLYPHVAKTMLHFWEEPFISGNRGSGAVFFSGCNLGCTFCQNYTIHDATQGFTADERTLSDLFLELAQKGAHNINLVTPTPHLPTIIKALIKAKAAGLTIPIVYNCGGYERAESIKALDGLIDVYLPDIKYVSSDLSRRFSGAADYFQYAAPAVEEMHRQVGGLKLNQDGIAVSGMVIRHLVLPCCIDDTRRVLKFIADRLPLDTQISLMRQYAPTPAVAGTVLDRKITDREYERSISYALSLGLTHMLIQEKTSASLEFTPTFTDCK